ncbi:PTB domain-containing engulfment adapter protein 1 isoform X1 [Physeter macrocephalus]|uniref:PTB domain-containing engulfment adapter protein 1 n=1 Tax=Physeter macrocephalus TaxID=9755 RepID=A0A455AIZ7_PHYMC|nr:PTB domain-containing engulfment adapter protein 1 isoform X1 [Physeter catodon]XP_028335693.1 PTB domain-containing engulfment adapter protein 1 isoform X1 [Physeter catodon]XP_028335694.1 PTB domain-containing engulfment adapter protein 1 isoform X1 [Physeter catodon]XP_028335699.1 PTB domain-containing engulfment adapter protein 1 isoform X1 [Physeter catodon]XP_028335704.1 PTB domain-containing engulfment adapter protein 1 isoform X1 [Physeter catodon]XP_028335708.1 PTB domain-containin|eukprot:XP_028335689.1 PTB domain-containing engulfment adapter protein 1 isoform X1 [Physeter catodon]
MMNRAFSRKKDKTWMHTPEALSKHYIPYNAKFLGSTEVEQPKGTEVVRDAVRKLKFARHIKKSEGQKIPKVELQISIYGVKILEPKTKEVQHNCQLHRISFCADDKTDKRIFTFICKDSESNKHLCYVFDSEKCAEEITLTIGQAFDLAYRKFLESGGKDVETRKQIAVLQKRIQDLETENMELKNKVQDLENQLRITQVSTSPLLHKMSDHEQHGFQRCSPSFWRRTDDSSPCLNISSITVTPVNSPDSRLSLGLLIPPPSKCGLPKPISESSVPRPHAGNVTPKSPSTDIFDMIPFSPISHQSSIPTRNGTQPPPVPSRSTEIKRDLFGAEPFDPFNCGAGDFPPDIQSKLDEMQVTILTDWPINVCFFLFSMGLRECYY